MAKGRMTLSIDDELVKKIKIYAIKNDTNVTAVVEQLIQEFLDKQENN